MNPVIKRPVIAPQTVLLLQFGNRGNLLSDQDRGEDRKESGKKLITISVLHCFYRADSILCEIFGVMLKEYVARDANFETFSFS